MLVRTPFWDPPGLSCLSHHRHLGGRARHRSSGTITARCASQPSCGTNFEFPGHCAAKEGNTGLQEIKFDWKAASPGQLDTIDIPAVAGYVHSLQSFTALDGPGVRFLVFLEGCGYRCAFCCNPDTWDMHHGKLMTSKELALKIERLKPYLDGHGGHTVGGVTVSGGEALLQPEFVAALFMEAHARGLTTCLDTTGGQGTQHYHWDTVLPHTDYVLFCVKSSDPERYRQLTERPMDLALRFWDELEKRCIKYWVRYVLIPGLTNSQLEIDKLVELCKGRQFLQAVELLPYHTLGVEKWKAMGLNYPLEGQVQPTKEEIHDFVHQLKRAGIPVMCSALQDRLE